ncbi:SRPBCC family protein [Mucilaginibacter sp. UR6-1]|uniref:SRPBCC family protein n=1 Tax=Mucilaginibacter sp. UR6-1 TaxID=1435643 RepID=UPI001E2B550F|nr:SRPBCC family protein [Mucilaginibacter sp. UR6-1]MCC8410569.1 SRPBCC family protein [Mucilaginibacter sp. UR6-1]
MDTLITITLQTQISAPIERVFNLARSIDLHVYSTQYTGEQAVAGRTSGLIGMGESVTWRAKHFGIWQKLTSKIIACDPHFYFADEMVKGPFKWFVHHHWFSEPGGQTTMKDIFAFKVPLGWVGWLFGKLVLKRYMTELLIKRNEAIKQVAEGDEWKSFIP